MYFSLDKLVNISAKLPWDLVQVENASGVRSKVATNYWLLLCHIIALLLRPSINGTNWVIFSYMIVSDV